MGACAIKIVDFGAFASAAWEPEKSSFRRQVVTDLLDAKIVIFKNVDFGLNLQDFDMAEPFPSALSKLGIETPHPGDNPALPIRLVVPRPANPDDPFVGDDDLAQVCHRSFGGDWGRLANFLRNCDDAVSRLREFTRTILKDHAYYSDAPVLRFGVPARTIMHLDPTPMESKEAFRAFVNLDDRPRLWRHSVSLYDFVESEYHNMDLGRFFRLQTPDRLAKLAKAVTRSSTFQEWPTTTIEIAPKDVWLFDARTIGHQLVAGRRAVSLTAKIRNDGLPSYHLRPRDRLYRIHARKEREASMQTVLRDVA